MAQGLNKYGRRLVLPGAGFNERSDAVNAGLLISVPTGSNGIKAAGQPQADAPKAETHSDDASFGHVLAQVGKQADSSTDKSDTAATSTSATEATDAKDSKDSKDPKDQTDSKNSTDSTAALSPLQMALALQSSVVTTVQTGQDGGQVKGDGQPATTQSTTTPLVTTAVDAQQTAQAVQAGSVTAAKADGSVPVVSTSMTPGSGAVPTAADKAGLTADVTSVDPRQGVSSANQSDSADRAATAAQRDLLAVAPDRGSTQPSDRSAKLEPGAHATDLQAQAPVQNQGVSPDKTAQVEASKTVPVATSLDASGRDAEPRIPAAPSLPRDGAGVKAETMAEANINVGQPIQTPSALNANQQAASSAQAGLQDGAMAEQARQVVVSGQAEKGRESGKSLKDAPVSQPVTGAERVGLGTGEGGTARIDGAAKVTAAAPVTALPAEPAAAPAVQSLHLEVERPDIGGVQVRVVLADQTVHAKVTTGQVEVRDFLIAKQDQLAVGLKASGLEMGDFQVDVGSQGRGQSGPGWFAGAQGDQADQGRRPPEPQAAPQPLFVEPRADQWSGYGHGALGGGAERRTLNVFA